MKRHKLYFTDEMGGFVGSDRQAVWIDEVEGTLHIGRRIRIPLQEVVSAEVRPLPRRPKEKFLAIDVRGPTIENGNPTTIRLIHKNFFMLTKETAMQEFVDELQPFLGKASLATENSKKGNNSITDGLFQCQYAFEISLLIGFYRRVWYSYDKPNTIMPKTLLLMLSGGIMNILGVLLIAVPFDNFKMSRNLRIIGWSRRATMISYLLLTFPAYIFWIIYLVKWVKK